jgi:Domain of unknown function (DUF4262)
LARPRDPSDPAEDKLLADVDTYGWHMLTIPEDDHGPGFTYSIGLFQTYGHPELIVFGLPNKKMQRIIDTVAGLIKTGSVFRDHRESFDILEGFGCVFRTVRREHYREHFGYAIWFYEGLSFPALQCVWPDNQHQYPWQATCQAAIRDLQPPLYETLEA